jgi:hypothetical protein
MLTEKVHPLYVVNFSPLGIECGLRYLDPERLYGDEVAGTTEYLSGPRRVPAIYAGHVCFRIRIQ